MNKDESVWIFNGSGGKFPGGVFSDFDLARKWIEKSSLTGVLTRYPVNEGCFDWALRLNLLNMKKETLEKKKDDPNFIGSFSTASQEHYHFEKGFREE